MKDEALRPEQWVADHNPSLAVRLLTGGDLRASVPAECEAAAGPIASESELARRCGASRPAVRDAVRTLRRAGLVRAVVRGRRSGFHGEPSRRRIFSPPDISVHAGALLMAEREQLLSQFVEWSRKHITGDEKGQAQIFLDRLSQALGSFGV